MQRLGDSGSVPVPGPSKPSQSTNLNDGRHENRMMSASGDVAPIMKHEERADTVSAGGDAAFAKLPKEIIEQILVLTTPNVFASLVVLNKRWRSISQRAHLYAHHLSQCPSYAAAHREGPVLGGHEEEDLPKLRRIFAQEIKRNLFEAYLRPRETVISLVSTSIGSSSAPGGEAFHFSISPRGHYILAYSSSRIHIIDVREDEIIINRELKILRRPASTTITDDGTLLAVLSADLQVDLYDLTEDAPKLTSTIALDHMPRTIALAPSGTVLAAAYDAGVEVLSIEGTYQNLGRRAVKCYPVDRLAFSQDGTQLLGSTLQSRSSSTVILTAPYFDQGAASPEESISALWTTSILFPNGSRDCSHATLLPTPHKDDPTWIFAYDRIFETFRAVRTDDLRNGTTYFTGPVATTTSKLLPSTLPAANETGELVASSFQGSIWLYGIPEDLEALPVTNTSNSTTASGMSTPISPLGRRNSAPSLRSVHRHRDSIVRIPQWQVLCDKMRNTFVEGYRVSSLDRCSALTWVTSSHSSGFRERLVLVAPGVASQCDIGEDHGMNPVDGGRISILDFDYTFSNGSRRSITIEVGAIEPQILEEEQRDLDTEVAIVRRRTVAQRRSNGGQVGRSATTISRGGRHDLMPMPELSDVEQFSSSSRPVRRPSTQTTSSAVSESTSLDDMEAFDAPYAHGAPRSQTTLRRAATAAAVNRRFTPIAPEHIEYRRADGRNEHPHESDADNWVPPPPPYSQDVVPPLPEHIQRSILAEAALATLQRNSGQRSPILDFPGLDGTTLTRSRTVASTSSAGSRRDRYQFQRTFSDRSPSLHTSRRLSYDEDMRHTSVDPVSARNGNETEDDLYGVSPENSPPLRPRRLSDPVPHTRLTTEHEATRSKVSQLERPPVSSTPTTYQGVTTLSPNQEVSTPSPKPIMSATIFHPASPVPEVVGYSSNAESRSDPRLVLRESQPRIESQDLNAASSSHLSEFQNRSHSTVESFARGAISTQPDLNKEVPPRPDSEHHLTELPPVTPIIADHRSRPESEIMYPKRSETAPVMYSPPLEVNEDPTPMWRRTGTAPAASGPIDNDTGVSMPTSDQLARLNSRTGRPPSAADPRRMSGSSGHRPSVSGSSQRDMFPWVVPNPDRTPPRLTAEQSFNQIQAQQQGAAYRGSYHLPRPNTGRQRPSSHQSSASTSSQRASSSPSPSSSSNRPHNLQLSLAENRQSSASPQLRPNMSRLETIHSVVSTPGVGAEPSPYFAPKQAFLGRNSSRAERSAAKNIKDAKQKGWRSSMKKERKKSKNKSAGWDVASSAGWTDVTVETSGELGRKEKKESKCSLM